MAEVSDEMLMAYADGVLDANTRAIVEAALERHPPYREKVEKFRATGGRIRVAFREDPGTTHLGPLIDRIRRDEAPPVAAATDLGSARVVPLFGDEAPTPTFPHRSFSVAAMAASVALLIGATLGWSLHSRPVATSPPASGLVRFSGGGLLAQGALQELLEGASSGTAVMAKAENGKVWQLEASFTFRSVSQTPCRRYEMSSKSTGGFAGYACRDGAGQWFVHAHAKLLPKVPSKGFAPAAGDGDAALEAAIRAAMDGDVYQAKEEAELLAGRWITVPK